MLLYWLYLLASAGDGFGTLEVSLLYDLAAQYLQCRVQRARGLRPMDIHGLTDSFCKLNILPVAIGSPSQRLRTKTVHKTRDPEYNETLTFYGITETDVSLIHTWYGEFVLLYTEPLRLFTLCMHALDTIFSWWNVTLCSPSIFELDEKRQIPSHLGAPRRSSGQGFSRCSETPVVPAQAVSNESLQCLSGESFSGLWLSTVATFFFILYSNEWVFDHVAESRRGSMGRGFEPTRSDSGDADLQHQETSSFSERFARCEPSINGQQRVLWPVRKTILDKKTRRQWTSTNEQSNSYGQQETIEGRKEANVSGVHHRGKVEDPKPRVERRVRFRDPAHGPHQPDVVPIRMGQGLRQEQRLSGFVSITFFNLGTWIEKAPIWW